MRIWVLRIATAILLSMSFVANAQGFGVFQRKTVTINRLLPPTVNLKGKKIRVEATADAIQRDGEMLRSLLKTKLVTLIQQDPRFILNDTSPETILKFTITNFYIEPWTEQVPNGTGGTTQRTVYGGKIEVAYQAIDVASNVALDSENLVTAAGYNPSTATRNTTPSIFARPDKTVEAAEASENETRDQLISNIVDLMGKRIAPLDEPIEVPLPGGKLEPLSALALSGRWGTLEEEAEKADKLPKDTDDTYRLYLIALAKEAQAYDLTREANERDLGKRTDISPAQAEAEFLQAQKYLDESGAIYKQIITANPKEKEFRPGDDRTEEALKIYAIIERYKEETAKTATAATPNVASASTGDAPASAAPAQQTPLEQILQFCSQGLALDSIKDYIDSPDFLTDAKATNYKFNFAKDPLSLNDTCKQNAAVIQHEMRLKLSSGTVPPHK